MNKDKIVFFLLIVMCSNFSLAQKVDVNYKNYQNLLEVFFSNERIIKRIKKDNKIPLDEKLYFLQNDFLKTNKKYSNEIRIKEENFFVDNTIGDIFYIRNIIKDSKLSVIEIAYKKHIGIGIHFRKSSDGKWRISDYSYYDDFSIDNKVFASISNKIYHNARALNDKRIKKIKKGMSKEEVNDIMKSNIYNRIIDSKKDLNKGDTLKIYKYTTAKKLNFCAIYFDNNSKVDSIRIAKDRNRNDPF